MSMRAVKRALHPPDSQPLTKTKIQKFDVGIRFESWIDGSKANESDMLNAHWVLIFERQVGDSGPCSVRIELSTHKDNSISFHFTEQNHFEGAHLIGTFEGDLTDVRGLMEIHPMSKWGGASGSYSIVNNNCQHWAATMLLYVKAFADSTPRRRFQITNLSRYNRVVGVLLVSGDSLYHKPNSVVVNMNLVAAYVGGIAALVTGAVAETTAVVSAPGIAGLLGFTTVAPTAMAAAAITAMPLVAGVAVISGGALVYNAGWAIWWKQKTMFADPEKRGRLYI